MARRNRCFAVSQTAAPKPAIGLRRNARSVRPNAARTYAICRCCLDKSLNAPAAPRLFAPRVGCLEERGRQCQRAGRNSPASAGWRALDCGSGCIKILFKSTLLQEVQGREKYGAFPLKACVFESAILWRKRHPRAQQPTQLKTQNQALATPADRRFHQRFSWSGPGSSRGQHQTAISRPSCAITLPKPLQYSGSLALGISTQNKI